MATSSVRERSAVEAFGRTNRGSRQDNQDAILVESPWFAVADGVGGHYGGAEAAAAAIAAVRAVTPRRPSPTAVVDAVLRAHTAVLSLAAAGSGDRRPATTLTVAGLSLAGARRTLDIAHVGDSRAYLISANGVQQLTIDHSLVNELVRAGRLTAEEAQRHPMRNIVTRVCGQPGPLAVDHYSMRVQPGDFLLLVSDGVPAHLSDEDMHFIVNNSRYLRDVPSTVEWAAGALVAHALARGGSDNASTVLLRVP